MNDHVFTAALKGRREIAASTMAFHFEKPRGFTFVPGQAVDILLPASNSTSAGASHTFSLASAPSRDELVIATRMRDSPYKTALRALPIGARVTIEGPFGRLTLRTGDSRPAILLAAGIGITPYVSILEQVAQDRVERRLVLLYSNCRPEDTAFMDELLRFEENNASFRLCMTMTRMQHSRRAWSGGKGRIDEARLAEATEGLQKPLFYIAGQPNAVQSLYELLINMGVSDGDIRTEDFGGY